MHSNVPFRLAVVGSHQHAGIQSDDARMIAALATRGVESTPQVWNDATADWASYDAILIRTTWDYFVHYAAFLAWLDRLEALGVPLINPVPLLRWNSDKRYLLQLERAGVAIVPTRWTAAGGLRATVAATDAAQLVVKPSVSGGAWHTVRGARNDPSFEAALAALPQDLDYLVQPFVPEIARDGEWSLLYFGGQFSHAVVKCAAVGDFRVQTQFGGSVHAKSPTAAIRSAADRALAAIVALGYADSSYARIDGVVVDRQFRIMEVEMIEPSLFLGTDAGASERFAAVLAERLLRDAGRWRGAALGVGGQGGRAAPAAALLGWSE